MKIKVGSLLGHKGHSLTVDEEVPGNYPEEIEQIKKSLAPLRIKATITNTGKSLLVQGKLAADVLLECTRCLADFSTKLDADFEDEFVKAAPVKQDRDNDDFFADKAPTYEGDVLDLSELIRESLLLAVPMKVICSTQCQGLCSRCGKRLADGDCDCPDDSIDPRMAPLADFFKK